MISVDLNKAKDITHEKRRDKRDGLFKQLDIEATIPMFAEQAEAQRQTIREEYAKIQTKIDNAKTIEELKTIITKVL